MDRDRDVNQSSPQPQCEARPETTEDFLLGIAAQLTARARHYLNQAGRYERLAMWAKTHYMDSETEAALKDVARDSYSPSSRIY